MLDTIYIQKTDYPKKMQYPKYYKYPVHIFEDNDATSISIEYVPIKKKKVSRNILYAL